ncbi:MAG: DUF4468 domain-containing protein [Bacteroidaceae bacterium]|nr:DUF4468 domain-containing protein [Bacteroidaceae bacterium]
MKRIALIALALVLPLCMNAQLFGRKTTVKQVDNSAYMQGTLPVADGKVVFSKTIAAPGKSKADLFKALASWASLRYMANSEHGVWNDADYYKNLEYAAVKTADPNAGLLSCFADEELVFSNRLLEKDFTRAHYTLDIKVGEGNVEVKMYNIYYIYNLSDEPEQLTAEDWITDKEAFTKKGKPIKMNFKFRVKTMDLNDELCAEIANAIK